jgi:eukaryotic-like serine/threonine-protein kinase
MPTCPACSEKGPPGALFCGSCGLRLVADSSDGAADPLIGKTLNGTYLIQQRIGSGGMGHVYRAIHTKLESPVAVKIVKRELLAHSAMAHRFQREARAASKLHHPNVVGVTDFGQAEDGTLFMVMEHVTGRNLSRVIAEEAPLPERRVVHIGAQILSALSVAHANDILHRDLKPENVMLEARRDTADAVKVLDFGIVKLLEVGASASTLTQAGLVCGTPGYMSPEQLRGDDLDVRSDLFSMGVVLYEMLTQKLPFDAQTPMELLHRHLSDPIEPPSERRGRAVSPALEDLVMATLSASRDERPPTADAMREALLGVALVTEVPPLDTEHKGSTEVLPRRTPNPPRATPHKTASPRPEGLTPSQPRRPSPPLDSRKALERETARPEHTRSAAGAGRIETRSDPALSGKTGGIDPALLRRIEERLAAVLGPVAPRLVRRVSQGAANVGAMCQGLLGFIPTKEDQERFLGWCQTELHLTGTRERKRAPSQEAPLAEVAWDPALLDRARRDLAVYVGPLARVIVRRVYPRARNPRDLYELLSLEIPSEADRVVFRGQYPRSEE